MGMVVFCVSRIVIYRKREPKLPSHRKRIHPFLLLYKVVIGLNPGGD